MPKIIGPTTALAGLIPALALSMAASGGSADGPANAQSIKVPGSDVVVRTFQQRANDGAVVPYYTIDLGDGRTVTRETSYMIKLRYADFEPLVQKPLVHADFRLKAIEGTESLYIVQYATQPLEVYRRQLRDLGATTYKFISNHAYIVKMDTATRRQVEDLPYVRWVGSYEPAYRVDEIVLENPGLPTLTYNVSVFFEEGTQAAQKAAVAERIQGLGGVVNKADNGKFTLVATLTRDQVREIASWNEVMFVDRWGAYEEDMNIVRQIYGTNDLENAAGYDGTGVRMESFDSGFNLNHGDFAHHPLIVHGVVDAQSHGTSTIGICVGDGTGNANARGVNPNGQGIVADYGHFGLSGNNRYNSSGDLPGLEAVFQTSSVGDPRTFFYNNISAESDAAIFDFDVVHCQSQSNAGNQNSRPQAWAKNMVSGGAVYHMGTAGTGDDRHNFGASTGPATDGRVKPTLTGVYDSIFTTSCCGTTSYTSSFGGTSGGTPIVCGHFGLLHQMWNDGIFGNDVNPNNTVFENKPHVATARALMINTADQYPLPAQFDITRYVQGWGRPNVKNLYDARDNMIVIDETDILSNLESTTYDVTVPGDMPLKVTMVYADPPGVPGSSQHRINDLTLRVTSPADVTYWGNVGLVTSNWSSSGGAANDFDVEENVFIENPEAGTWTVEVIASEINEDSHVETGTVDADYALVITGVDSANPGFPLDFTVTAGTYISGNVGDLFGSDDSYVRIQQQAGVSPTSPLAEIEIESFAAADNPSALSFTLEAAASALPAGSIPQQIDLFNYDTATWEQVDLSQATFGDSVVVVSPAGDLGRFIDDGSLTMAARVGWYNSTTPLFSVAWMARIDQAIWTITP